MLVVVFFPIAGTQAFPFVWQVGWNARIRGYFNYSFLCPIDSLNM